MFISFFETSHTLLHFIRTGDNFKHDQLSCYIDILTTTLLVFYRSSSILNIFNVYKKKMHIHKLSFYSNWTDQ